jgi:hypothetical protein
VLAASLARRFAVAPRFTPMELDRQRCLPAERPASGAANLPTITMVFFIRVSSVFNPWLEIDFSQNVYLN